MKHLCNRTYQFGKFLIRGFRIFLIPLLLSACTKAKPNLSFLDASKNDKNSASQPTSQMSMYDPATTNGIDTTPTFRIAGLSSGDSISVFSDSNCGTNVNSGTSSGSTYDFTDSSLSSDGNYTYYYKVNSGSCKTGLTYSLDRSTSLTGFSNASLYQRVSEGSGSQSFQISLTAPKNYDLKIYYDVSGTSSSGVQHNLSSGNVTVSAGQTSATISFNVLDNFLTEGETDIKISLTATDSVGIRFNSNDQARMYIVDNESTYAMPLQVALGAWHNCIVDSGGTLKCWGENSSGQLGNGTSVDSFTKVSVGSGYSDVAVNSFGGSGFSCGIHSSGLKCWGYNGFGQLGDGTAVDKYSPTLVSGGLNFQSVSLGMYHTCGVTTSGAVYCWGYNLYGQLGDSTTISRTTPTAVTGLSSGVARVFAGAYHSCALLTNNSLKCWGQNSSGQLGIGNTTNQSSPYLVTGTYTEVSLGTVHSCAIGTDNALRCWGEGDFYRLGTGATTDLSSPAIIDSGVSYVSIGAGDENTCAVTSSNALKCWGRNNTYGLAGIGNFSTWAMTPQTVFSGYLFYKVKLGLYHACAEGPSHAILCWGSNEQGQLGDNLLSLNKTPQLFSGTTLSNIVMSKGYISPGNQICGIMTDSSLWCGGNNTYGTVGDGTNTDRSRALMIDYPTSYSKVATAGDSHSCGITSNGVLKCWGSNVYGQIGDGSITSRTTPTISDTGTNYSEISVGVGHTCGITSTGALKCWGYNMYGQLGNASTGNQTSPALIDSGTTYSKISLGSYHSCGVTSGGVLKCWGYNNYGQVGDASTTNRNSPTIIDSGTVYVNVFSGGGNNDGTTCAITNTGVLKCWGRNDNGQIGNGTLTTVTSPSIIDSGTTYSKISSSGVHTCGILTNGSLKCWGYNVSGQVGDNTQSNRSTPVLIDSGVSYSDIAAGSYFSTCGITTSGALKCWGNSGHYQMASGTKYNLPWTRMLGAEGL